MSRAEDAIKHADHRTRPNALRCRARVNFMAGRTDDGDLASARRAGDDLNDRYEAAFDWRSDEASAGRAWSRIATAFHEGDHFLRAALAQALSRLAADAPPAEVASEVADTIGEAWWYADEIRDATSARDAIIRLVAIFPD